jgi:hypothetical protein
MKRCILILLAANLVMCNVAFAEGDTHPSISGKVLETFPLAAKPGYAYQLAIGICQEREEYGHKMRKCPVLVQWLNNGNVVSSKTLRWAISDSPIEMARRDTIYPEPYPENSLKPWAADPADTRPARGWFNGEEESSIGLYPRLVWLDARRQGLLVSCEGGFEHVHRWHQLFVGADASMKMAWEDGDEVGPRYTWMVPVSQAGHPPYFLFLNVFSYPDDTEPDTWSVTRYQWSQARTRLERRGMAGSYATILGSFPAVAEAHAFRKKVNEVGQERKCGLPYLDVLATDVYPKLRPHLYIVAAMSVEKWAAEAKRKNIKACNKSLDPYTKRVQ